MTPEDTGYHAPISLAEAKAARAKRRVRAGGRVPSDFMPFDDGVDPANDHPIEGGGFPWLPALGIGAFALCVLALAARGIYSFFH